MDFYELVDEVAILLQQRGKLTYRSLRRQFGLDDEALYDLKEELLYAYPVVDDEGRGLIWTEDAEQELASTVSQLEQPPPAPERDPASYTPQHLAKKILTSRSALEGERKQVTVLFADVAGFSTLSEHLDAEAVHLIMDGCFDILTRHVHYYEGTINQFTGDGIMALFGAPITHEDHAMRALHAALDIQEAIRDYDDVVRRQWGVPFQMRLGLNTGTVVVGRIGDDLRMDYTAQGDTTNLAARMQQMAPAGGIWVAEATYRVAPEAFDWRPLGSQTVKGRVESVAVYDLRGRREVHSRFDVLARRGLTPLVGRDAELAQLLETWGKAQNGHGQVMSIVGEAGLGKSRLLYEFKQQLLQHGVRYVEGTCFTYGESISYLPFLDVVQALCGLEPHHAEDDAKQQIAQRLSTLGLEHSAIASYLHNLLSLAVEDDVFPKLTPEHIRRRTVEALNTLVIAEARHQPLVLVLEDVHWIDKATEEVLGALVEAMTDTPLLLLLLYRPAYVQSWIVQAIQTKAYASQVEMTQLSVAQRTEMTQALLGVIPTELEQLIVDKTDGNPLFVEELCRSLVESGALTQAGSHYILHAALDTLDMPTTLQGVLLARIDRLNETLKDVLQRAAVIGRVFSYPLLSQVVEQDVALEPLLGQLEKLAFIYPTSLAPQRAYSFKHVLTQEAVYQTLLRPRREAYHVRVGKAIEALYPDRLEEVYERLAYHYGRGGNPDKAVEYLALANQKAARANAMGEAKTHFDGAMTFLNSMPETDDNRRRRITLLLNQQTVMTLLLKYAEYYDQLTRYEPIALELGDPGLLGMYYGRMGWGEWGFSQLDQAIQNLTKAATLCEDVGNTEDAAQAHLLLQWSHLMKGDFDKSLASQEQVLRLMQQQFNLRWYMWTVTGAARSYICLGRWDAALAEARKGIKVGEQFSDDSLISFAAWTLSLADTAKGDLKRAVDDAELALEKAPTPLDTLWSQSALAWAWSRSGEPNKGIEVLARTVPLQRAAPWISSEWFAPFLGEAYWLAGHYDKARQTLEENLNIAERAGMNFHIGVTHRLLGEVALSNNPAQQAVPLAASHFEQSIAILRQIEAENELALAYSGRGRLHAQQGNITLARGDLTRALDIFKRLGTLGEPDKVRHALEVLPEG